MASNDIEPRSYVDFEPRIEWFKGKESDTIIVDVSGFNKEQLKVLINTAGNLKISGERPIEGLHWSRFICNFTIPKKFNMKEIQAKYDGNENLLYVILPNSISVQDSSIVTTNQRVKFAPEEEEKGEILDEKINKNYNKEDRKIAAGRERKGIVIGSVMSKSKLVILSVIFGVMVSLGLAVYLSYRLKGL